MAVGDADYESSSESTVKAGSKIALAAWLVGVLAGAPRLRALGLGATLGLWGVRMGIAASKRKPATVPVAAGPTLVT